FYYRSRLRNAPYFTANLSARYDWQNAIQHKALLSLSYNFAYVHEFLRDWEGVGGANLDFVPAQVLHDLGLTYTFPNKKITMASMPKIFLTIRRSTTGLCKSQEELSLGKLHTEFYKHI